MEITDLFLPKETKHAMVLNHHVYAITPELSDEF